MKPEPKERIGGPCRGTVTCQKKRRFVAAARPHNPNPTRFLSYSAQNLSYKYLKGRRQMFFSLSLSLCLSCFRTLFPICPFCGRRIETSVRRSDFRYGVVFLFAKRYLFIFLKRVHTQHRVLLYKKGKRKEEKRQTEQKEKQLPITADGYRDDILLRFNARKTR